MFAECLCPTFFFLETHVEMKRRTLYEENFQWCVCSSQRGTTGEEVVVVFVLVNTFVIFVSEIPGLEPRTLNILGGHYAIEQNLQFTEHFSARTWMKNHQLTSQGHLISPGLVLSCTSRQIDARKTLQFPLFRWRWWSTGMPYKLLKVTLLIKMTWSSMSHFVSQCLCQVCLTLDCLSRENAIMLLAKWIAIDYAWEWTSPFWITKGNKKHWQHFPGKKRALSHLLIPQVRRKGQLSPPMQCHWSSIWQAGLDIGREREGGRGGIGK